MSCGIIHSFFVLPPRPFVSSVVILQMTTPHPSILLLSELIFSWPLILQYVIPSFIPTPSSRRHSPLMHSSSCPSSIPSHPTVPSSLFFLSHQPFMFWLHPFIFRLRKKELYDLLFLLLPPPVFHPFILIVLVPPSWIASSIYLFLPI